MARGLFSILGALAILSVASVIGAGEASAHGGRPHHWGIVTDASSVDTSDAAIIDAELAKLASEAGDPQSYAGRQAWDERQPRACDGHCCGIAGPSCCSFAPPLAASTPCRNPTRHIAALPAHDGERDGLGPRSILRPPRVPA